MKFSFDEFTIEDSERLTEMIASKLSNTEKFKLVEKEFGWYVAQQILGPDPKDTKMVSYKEAMTHDTSKLSESKNGDSVNIFAEIIDIDPPWVNSSRKFMFTAFARDKLNEDKTFRITAFSTAIALYSNMAKGKRYIIHGVVDEYNQKNTLKLNNTLRSWMLEVDQTKQELLTNKRKCNELPFTLGDGVIIESDEIKERKRICNMEKQERIRDAQEARSINESKVET